MKIKIGDLTKIKTGKLDANASSEDGQYPFFTCSKEPLKISTYSYDCECVLVAGNGDLNVKYYNGKFDAYQRTYIIENNSDGKLYMPYLYLFMEEYVEELRRQAIGGVIKYIKLGNLTDAMIELPSVEEQRNIVKILFKAKQILEQREIELEKLDELIRARFVELFGEPEANTKNWPVVNMADLCTVGSSKRIYQSEQSMDGVPFWRISDLTNLISTGMATAELFIPEERYMMLQAQKQVPVEGDILVTSRGTLGQCYIVRADDKFYFQDGMISWLSEYADGITPLYIAYLFSMPGFRKQIDSMQAGSTVAYLSIAMIRKLKVMLPDMETQNQFSAFVAQIDKSKFDIHKFLYCTTHNTQSIIKPRLNTKESGKTRGGKLYADEF